MLRIQVEVDGGTVGDLYRRIRAIAEEISQGGTESDQEYQGGFGDGPMYASDYHLFEVEEG